MFESRKVSKQDSAEQRVPFFGPDYALIGSVGFGGLVTMAGAAEIGGNKLVEAPEYKEVKAPGNKGTCGESNSN